MKSKCAQVTRRSLEAARRHPATRANCKMTTSSGHRGLKRCARIISRYTILVALLLALHLVCEVQCQFFTKANSKSIPRMGRRSPADSTTRPDAYKRMLIDRLVDEFGPDLLLQLARSENQARSVNVESRAGGGGGGGGGGEQYMRNDQPFDVNLRSSGDERQQRPLFVEPEQMGRDERSVYAGPVSSRQNYRDNANSLAMRAFNAERLLRHLAAGGSPITPAFSSSPAYENIVVPKDPRGIMYD